MGEAQPAELDLLGLTDVVLEKIMSTCYVPRSTSRREESFAMFHLLRVRNEWPGRNEHRWALVEVRRRGRAEADARRRGVEQSAGSPRASA